jgi:uncharacterized membrane protein YphA (DoxX/SURF4 family)
MLATGPLEILDGPGVQRNSNRRQIMMHAFRRSSRTLAVLMSLPLLVAALGIGLVGVTKFLQTARWVGMFVGWGYPAAFTPIVGAVEILGAVALLVPRLTSYAAMVLGIVMASAAFTLWLHPNGPLGRGTTPCIYFALLVVVGLYRWPRRLSAPAPMH